MAFDFPASPTAGQEFTPVGGPTYVWESPRWLPKAVIPGVTISDTPPSNPVQGQLWLESDTGNLFAWWNDGDSAQWVQVSGSVAATPTAEARNRIVNGAMQISQEWGNTAIGPASSTGPMTADQWTTYLLTTVGTITAQRVQSVTPNGSKYRIRATVGTAKATLAAGDGCSIFTAIEGIRVADFRYGSASAKQAVLRFGWKSPAGTYGVNVNNGAYDRSYIVMFTVTAGQANTDTTQTFVIPGDVTGTWLTDTGIGMYLGVNVAGGSAGIGVAGWQAGGLAYTSAQTNGMATAGAVYELFDVGLYLDPNATGVPPPWQMPDEADELLACRRYYTKYEYNFIVGGQVAVGGGATILYSSWPLPIRMRTAAPALTLVGQTLTNCTLNSASVYADGFAVFPISGAAGGSYYNLSATAIVVNARM